MAKTRPVTNNLQLLKVRSQALRLYSWVKKQLKHFWRASIINKIICGVLAAILVLATGSYGIAQWYIYRHKNDPLIIGATFIPDYAREFGLEPKATMEAMIQDLGIRNFRLVSYWDKSEPTEGIYDFSDLDWQFKLAEQTGSKISLAIGLRQPRWPECHGPQWAMKQDMSVWAPKLKTYMGAVISRYKDSPALVSYQLENEFFLSVFGICPDFSRSRLVDEFNYVKSKDSTHKVIVTRSNNWVGVPVGAPRADEFGVSVYKRVWEKTTLKRYYEYPIPAWYYATLAGVGELLTGKNLVIHELQTEAWVPDGFGSLRDLPLSEAYKSLSPELLKSRIDYGVATGLKSIDLWGPEWWYYAKEKKGDPALWNAAKESLQKYHKTTTTK